MGTVFVLRTLLASAANGGVQWVYTISLAAAAPLFNVQYGLSTPLVTLVLALSAPLSGILLQPLVGGLSDRLRSRWGKRRPFIAAGSLLTAMAMMLVAFSTRLGGLWAALLGFVLTNLFVNLIAGPARAVVADNTPPARAHLANSLLTTMMMASAVLAPLIGAQLFYTDEPYTWLFLMGAVVVLLSGLSTVAFASEASSLDAAADSTPHQRKRELFLVYSMWAGLVEMPRSLLRVLLAFFASSCAFAPFLILQSLWWARNVFGGADQGYGPVLDVDSFNNGIHMSLYALSAFAAVTLLFSLVLPLLVPALGVKVVYVNVVVMASICFGLFVIVTNVVPGFALMCGAGPLAAVQNTLPFALIRIYGTSERTGFYVGIFNATSNLAQVLLNLSASGLLALVNQNVMWGIGLGAILGLAALTAIFFLPNSEAENDARLRQQMALARVTFSGAMDADAETSESDWEESESDVERGEVTGETTPLVNASH